MDVPIPTDGALSQPTRARLFAALSDLRRPAGTEELAEALALHPNGVRVHLEHMREAGLLQRERVRQARGRPRDMWTIAASAQPGGDPPSAYADLGRWLARLVATGKTSLRKTEAAGRDIGHGLVSHSVTGSAEENMHASLVALGFQPAREPGPAGQMTYKLCNCPYRDAATESRDVVCTLHRGITRGLLDELAPETRLAAFVPKDPRTAGCLIELSGGLAGEPAAVVAQATARPTA